MDRLNPQTYQLTILNSRGAGGLGRQNEQHLSPRWPAKKTMASNHFDQQWMEKKKQQGPRSVKIEYLTP